MSVDVEKNDPVKGLHQTDPYQLRRAYKSDISHNSICVRGAGRLFYLLPFTKDSAVRKRKQVQQFYTSQNERIERMLQLVNDYSVEAKLEEMVEHRKVQIAIYASLVASILLAALQVFAAVTSDSLCLFTTMAGAIFDPLSNLALIISNRTIKKVDLKRFPAGKARLETLGNISFCFIMISVSLFLIILAIRQLLDQYLDKNRLFHLPSVIAVIVAFIVKLNLFFYCWRLKDKYSHVNILWKDHRNDLFINGFAIVMNVLGSKLRWWIDPTGTIIVSIIVSIIWLRAIYAEFLLLVGITASTEMYQIVTYICLTHSSSIKGIHTVRVYHSGPRLIAEANIFMNPDTSLRQIHGTAGELQRKLNNLPDIERAYVHVEYC